MSNKPVNRTPVPANHVGRKSLMASGRHGFNARGSSDA